MVNWGRWCVRVAVVLSLQFDPIDAGRLTARGYHRGGVTVHVT